MICWETEVVTPVDHHRFYDMVQFSFRIQNRIEYRSIVEPIAKSETLILVLMSHVTSIDARSENGETMHAWHEGYLEGR
eukprot:scaffold62365_cov44-Cyclotella_meneghiniana.AAC.5